MFHVIQLFVFVFGLYCKLSWGLGQLSLPSLQVSVHPGCARGQGQGERLHDTSTFGIHKNR